MRIIMALEMRYFVLKPRGNGPHAEASREAMRRYATCIRSSDPELAEQLICWANEEYAKVILERLRPLKNMPK
jgi:hypothetical protein